MAEKRQRAERELREQLGRDPTEDEVLAHLGVTCER
jgi:DNA-directed RNA polymerase specialized sigma subunit